MMNEKLGIRFIIFSFLVFTLLLIGGCPCAMDTADAKLTAINNSNTDMLFVAKDRKENIISWEEVHPKSSGGLAVVNQVWTNILPHPTDKVKIYCKEFSKWDQTKGWAQVNDQTSLKHTIYTRAQLDSVGWKTVYP